MKKSLLISSLLLSFLGGYLDSYSLLYRGGKFAFMQTGNIITIATDIVQKNYHNLFLSLILFISFIIGIVFSYFFTQFLKKKNKEKYLHSSLLILMLLLIPPNYFFDISNPQVIDISWICMVSLGIMGGILLESFKSYYVNFAPTMMTNNTKLMIDLFLEGATFHQKDKIKKGLIYLLIIIFFILGVIVNTLLNKYLSLNYLNLIIAQLNILILIYLDFNYLIKN